MHFKVCTRYFYTKLNDEEKKAYKTLLGAWLNYEPTVTLNFPGVDVNKLITNIHDDNPELFYIDFTRVACGKTPFFTRIMAQFRFPKEECERLKGIIAGRISEAQSLCNGAEDKLRLLHDYLAKNIVYTMGDYHSGVHSVDGALVKGQAVCEGYARAFKLMCDAVDIPCIVINGTAVNHTGARERHAWNIIRRNNKCYHVDLTWNRDLVVSGRAPFYYNLSDAQISKDHSWEGGVWPSCRDGSEFEGQFAYADSLASLEAIVVKAVRERQGPVSIRFNRKFKNEAELADLISTIVRRKFLRVRGLAVSYQQKADCATVEFKF